MGLQNVRLPSCVDPPASACGRNLGEFTHTPGSAGKVFQVMIYLVAHRPRIKTKVHAARPGDRAPFCGGARAGKQQHWQEDAHGPCTCRRCLKIISRKFSA